MLSGSLQDSKEGSARPAESLSQSQPLRGVPPALKDWAFPSSLAMCNDWLGAAQRKHVFHTNVMVDFGVDSGLLDHCAFCSWRTAKCLWPPQDPYDIFSHSTLCFFFINTCHIAVTYSSAKASPGQRLGLWFSSLYLS